MSADRSEIIVLCEGSADEQFIRRFLKLRGYNHRKVDVRPFPAGKGCGEQFVRNKFPGELKALRRSQAKGLIVLIDGDGKTVAQRKAELDAACDEAGVPRRRPDEAVFIAVPQRNIESWFVYLEGDAWSETADHAKRKRDDLARTSAEKLHALCFGRQSLPMPAPTSLQDACAGWRRFS